MTHALNHPFQGESLSCDRRISRLPAAARHAAAELRRTGIDSMYFSGIRPAEVTDGVAYDAAGAAIGVVDPAGPGWVLARPGTAGVHPRLVWMG